VGGVRRAKRQLKEPGIGKRLVKSVLGDMVTNEGGEWQRGHRVAQLQDRGENQQ